MLATITAAVLTLVLVVGLPALSYKTARNPAVRDLPRLNLYLSAVLSQWLLTLVASGIVYLVLPSVFMKGFAATPLRPFLAWSAGIAAASLLGVSLVVWCQRRGWLPAESDLLYRLIPETPQEKFWAAVIVAPTAAFCEEFLFRGFLLSQFTVWLHRPCWAWVASSVAFGLAHFYQGWSGMVRAALLGALLACPVVYWGSLYPAILAHWMIDGVAFVWLGPWMRRQSAVAEDDAP